MLEFGNNTEQMKGVIDAASSAAMVFAGVMGARYVGALEKATTAKIQNIAASRQQAAADAQAAQNVQIATNALVRKTLADKEAALSAVNLAQAEYNVARGSSAEAIALDNLIATKTAARNASLNLAQAEMAQATAQNAAATSARNASVAFGMARGALALVGGPAGAAMLAGAAIFYFYQKAQQARQESIEFADSLDGVLAKMKEMNSTQLSATIAKAEQSILDQRDAIAELQEEYDRLSQKKAFIEQAAQMRGATAVAEDYANINRELAVQAGKVDSAETRLSQTVSSVGILRAQLNGTLLQGIDLLRRDGEAAGVTAGMMNNLGKMLNYATVEKEKFNSSSIKIERPKGVQDYLDKLSAQVELQGELNERKRAQLKAEQEIRQLGGNENDVRLARERAGAEFDSVEAQKAQKKAADQAASSGKQAATQAESVAQKLENLKQQSELAAGSTQELSRDQAVLVAQQSLGKAATQEQIALAGKYRGEIWDTANALKAQAAAEKLIPENKENASYKQDVSDLKSALDAKKITQDQYNAASIKMEQQHQINLAKIRADQVSISPIAEARGQVDPVQQLVNENSQKLALMQQYQQQEQAIIKQSYQQGKISYDQFIAAKSATDAQYLALRTAQETQFNEQMTAAQWQLLSQQGLGYDMLTSAVDAFSGNASNAITGLITGTMSAQDAMRSLGSTMLNSVVNTLVQVGVEALKNFIIGQTMGTAAAGASIGQAAVVASAWAPAAAMASLATMGANAAPAAAGITSTVGLASGLAVAGMRKNGGPVSAGSMYQVGEGGMPEIYQASTGKQYMIPGDNGKVISNKDMQGRSGVQVIFNVQNMSSATFDARATDNGNGTITVDAIIADLNNGGPISQAITGNTTAKRTPRGQV